MKHTSTVDTACEEVYDEGDPTNDGEDAQWRDAARGLGGRNGWTGTACSDVEYVDTIKGCGEEI
jgi:hypothetical protein